VISIAYGLSRLIQYQLHKLSLMKVDRPFSTDRHLLDATWSIASAGRIRLDRHRPGRPSRPASFFLGAASAARHARAAWLGRTLAAQGFPANGGHPHTQGLAHAHRSPFVQRASRQLQVAIWSVCSAAWLYALGVGGSVRGAVRALLAAAGVGGNGSSVLGEGKGMRTSFGLWPAVGFSGAGALALMRAPALPCGRASARQSWAGAHE
jgi:hypothetical protein